MTEQKHKLVSFIKIENLVLGTNYAVEEAFFLEGMALSWL